MRSRDDNEDEMIKQVKVSDIVRGTESSLSQRHCGILELEETLKYGS